ncbi:MAG: hypothetical protein GQ527_08720 [Bacteroidales bacterium]|nr:hypothetical protein [Bacteroidales bacterium]
MKLLLAALLSFTILISFGQSKFAKKSERLFEKGKYEKCIKKTKKYLSKERKSPELQYYIVQSNLALYREADKKKSLSFLRKTITSWERLVRYNTNQIDYASLKNSIQESINQEILSTKLKGTRKGEYYHNKLAEVFLDTTDHYKISHPTLFFVEQRNIEAKVLYNDPFFENLSEKRIQILQAANKVVGVRYKYAGVDSTGFDCSGFTQYVYKKARIEIPHNANLQYKIGDTIDLSEAQPGDLIFFGSGSRAVHAGLIYSNIDGEIELVHCASRGVTHDTSYDENTKYWLKQVLCVQQMLPADEER